MSRSVLLLASGLDMTSSTDAAEEARMHLTVRLADIIGEVRHAEWRVQRLPSDDSAGRTTAGRADGSSSSQAIPLIFVVLAHGLQLVVYPLDLVRLPLGSDFAHGADNACAATNGIGAGLVLGLFLLCHGPDLVEVAGKHGCIWDVLGRLGELEEHHT